MGRGQGESQETLPNKVEIFNLLLRNKVNKANIERGRTKKNQKGRSQRTGLSRMEIFRWLLRNGVGTGLVKAVSSGRLGTVRKGDRRKTLELTKKDTPHPTTKQEPQLDGRRGVITIKSNLITTGWLTHKLENTYTTEVQPPE